MNKRRINAIVAILMIIVSISLFVTGLIKFPGLIKFFGISYVTRRYKHNT